MSDDTRPSTSITGNGFKALAALGLLTPAAIVLGIPELFVPAAAIAACFVVVWLRWALDRSRLDIVRRVPIRAHAGRPISCTLEVHSRRTTGVLALTDRADGAVFDTTYFAPVRSSDPVALRYPATPLARGTFVWGPVEVSQVDPLGLLQRRRFRGGEDSTLVWPTVHPLGDPQRSARSTDEQDRADRYLSSRRTEDLAGLRPYQPGDDIRHVHWAGVARTGQLIVRHFEQPDPMTATVVLDDRGRRHTHNSFERAVEAAASAMVTLVSSGRRTLVVTSTGRTIVDATDQESCDVALDALAVIDTDRSRESVDETAVRTAADRGGFVVWCGASVDVDAVAALRRRRHGIDIIYVVCHSAAFTPIAGVRTVAFTRPEEFAPNWRSAMDS